MKKIMLIILTLTMVTMGLVGCGPKTTDKTDDKVNENVNDKEDDKAEIKYPTKPVQVIIPYAPGGGSDILTRAIMKYIDLPNKQNLVAINVEGAAGFIGAQQAANSPNDGYTILAHNPMDVVSYTLNGTAETELWSEMELVCGVVDDFNVISTNKKNGFESIEAAVEYIKANPGEVKWGVTGSGNVNYADTLRVLRELGIENDVTIVPYDGGSASKTALMGNQIQMETNSSSDIRSSVESGDALPLLVIGDRRAAALPDVPSTQELGMDVQTTKPRGYYAPKGTDLAVIDILAKAIEEVVMNEEFKTTVTDLGLEVNFIRADEMNEKVGSWVEKLKPVFEEMLTE
ncbi:MAG TPA: tripartite tricarboxylate transporter substrate binding protein [Mobilitalea sp.]|nr:tripartite tricarboxylate transporter substrate binding protein [Mobilitalea sp.]